MTRPRTKPTGTDSWTSDVGLLAEDSHSAKVTEAERILNGLASVFFPAQADRAAPAESGELMTEPKERAVRPTEPPNVAERYRTLVEQIPAVIFMVFLDRGIGEAYVSPQIEAMLGFTQAEWLNDPVRWYRHIHPDDKDRWSAEAAQMFLTGEPLKSVYRVLARDGRVVWFHCEAKMVRSEDGRPWFIHGVGFDISDLKQAEAALREEIGERRRTEDALRSSEGMLRGLFEFAPDTIVVVDHSGRIATVNSQCAVMFGYIPEDLVGEPVEVLLPERFRQGHIHHRTGYAVEPHTRTMGAGLELYGKRKDCSEFPVDIMLSPIDTKEGSLVIAVVRDITRRKQAEEAQLEYAERLKVLSHRLMEVQESERRNIARELHDEIGQALTGLKLTLEMGARLPPDQTATCLGQALIAVNELMAQARKLSLDLRPGMLDDLGLLPALLWHIEHYTAQTRVHVSFKHSGLEGRRFSPEIETAAYRIVQEALTNVARHARVGEAEVRVWTDDQSLAIQVEDKGAGFDTEAVSVASDKSGLAGMRERAMLLGGQLKIDSKPGAGARLTARLKTVAAGQ